MKKCCENCEYWMLMPAEEDIGYGECELARTSAQDSMITKRLAIAFADMANSGASLVTRERFYCNQFDAKSKDEVADEARKGEENGS